jgi:hypothetical protein
MWAMNCLWSCCSPLNFSPLIALLWFVGCFFSGMCRCSICVPSFDLWSSSLALFCGYMYDMNAYDASVFCSFLICGVQFSYCFWLCYGIFSALYCICILWAQSVNGVVKQKCSQNRSWPHDFSISVQIQAVVLFDPGCFLLSSQSLQHLIQGEPRGNLRASS